MKCVNCGRNETDKILCDSCRKSYPGTKEELEKMIEAFRLVMGREPSLGREKSVNGSINNQNPDARVRIKCRCGTTFVALIPITLVRTWQTQTCTQCGRKFKTHYLEPTLGGTGWTIYGEGDLCDLCHKVKPQKDAFSPDGKLFHLCSSCFDDQYRKSAAMGGPIGFRVERKI